MDDRIREANAERKPILMLIAASQEAHAILASITEKRSQALHSHTSREYGRLSI